MFLLTLSLFCSLLHTSAQTVLTTGRGGPDACEWVNSWLRKQASPPTDALLVILFQLSTYFCLKSLLGEEQPGRMVPGLTTRKMALPGRKRPWDGNGDSCPFFEVPSVIDSRFTQFPGVPFTSLARWSRKAPLLHQKPRHASVMWILQEDRSSAAELAGTPNV